MIRLVICFPAFPLFDVNFLLSFVVQDFFAFFHYLFNFSVLKLFLLSLSAKRYMPFYLSQYL